MTTIEMTTHQSPEPKVGDTMTLAGIEYKITAVTPTKIDRDEYGLPVDWPGFSVSAVAVNHPSQPPQ